MINTHIVAFNAEEYQEALAPQFPQLDIRTAHGKEDLAEGIEEAEIIIAFGTQMNDGLFARNKNLKWVQALGTGVDGIADQPSLRKDVIVTSMRGIHGPQMSEMAFMLMLALNRNFRHVARNQDRRVWDRRPPLILQGKTVGILGVGIIAEALARRCKAFEMSVVGITSTLRELENFDRMCRRAEITDAVRELDYLIVLLPLSEESEKIINAEVLAAMKPTSFLINLARGGVVEEEALVNALNDNQIAGAGIDVFLQEPLPKDHIFWGMEKVILTPHMGGMSEAYVTQALKVIEPNLHAFFAGRPDEMINLVDH